MKEEKSWIGHCKHEIDKEMRTRWGLFWQQHFGQQHDIGEAVGSDQANVRNGDTFDHSIDISPLEIRERLKADSTMNNAYHCTVTDPVAHAGLESPNLIFGVDFTESDESTRNHSFMGLSLNHIGHKLNRFEQAISIFGKSFAALYEDKLIPCFGFGDSSTHDQDVFSFYPDKRFCSGFDEVLSRYREIAPNVQLAGPTSFAPIIEMAMTTVEQSGGQYHILVILANGQVTRSIDCEHGRLSTQEQKTVDAIVEASKFPLSIILVGVGDGPWDKMKEFLHNIPTRAFDNFQFVHFAEIMSNNIFSSRRETAFAIKALMEIPSQYMAIRELGLLGSRKGYAAKRVALSTPSYCSTSFDERVRSRYMYDNTLIRPSSTYEVQSGVDLKPLFSVLTRSREFLHKVIPYVSIALARTRSRTRSSNEYFWDLVNSMQDANREFLLPLYGKLNFGRNTPLGENALICKPFRRYICDSMLNIPPTYHGALLFLCVSLITSQMKNITAPFQNYQLEEITNASPEPRLLTFVQAYDIFFPEIFCLFLWISAPFCIIPQLVHKAAETGVSCGSIKLPLFLFTFLVAVGILVLFGLATWHMAYCKWRLSNGNLRAGDVDDAIVEELHEAFQG